jgi:hypothetical protein
MILTGINRSTPVKKTCPNTTLPTINPNEIQPGPPIFNSYYSISAARAA